MRLSELVRNRWALVPFLLLGLSATMVTTTVTLALSHDPGAEPGYYEKALDWDDERAAQLASDKLRWTATSIIERSPDDATRARLRVSIADKHGIAIEGAAVRVEAFPIVAATGARSELALREIEPGVYVATIEDRVPGRWVFRVRADRGAQHFRDEFERTILFGRLGD